MNEIVGYLAKQPKYKIKTVDGRIHTGYYNEWFRPEYKIAEIDVPIIKGTLRLKGYGRGRSSATFEWVNTETGSVYISAMSSSFQMFQRSNLGILWGYFSFQKQGTQVSIYPLDEEAVAKNLPKE